MGEGGAPSADAGDWVIYLTPPDKNGARRHAVCTTAEWEERDVESPGVNLLIGGGFADEGEAMRMARDLTAAEPPGGSAARDPGR